MSQKEAKVPDTLFAFLRLRPANPQESDEVDVGNADNNGQVGQAEPGSCFEESA